MSSLEDPTAPPFALRAPRPSDLDALHRLIRRVEEHDGIPVRTPRSELDDWLEEPHFDLERDARVCEDGGDVVAWGRVWHQPSTERLERAYLFGAVEPAWRGRGLGSAMLRWQLEHGTAKMREGGSGLPCFLRTHVFDFQHAAIRLFVRHGMKPVRWGHELLLDLTEAQAAADVSGVAIVPWDPQHAEGARVALNEAFADHWGSTPRTPEGWEHVLGATGTRTDLSFMALDGGRVVGASVNGHFPEDEAVSGRREGWIFQVGVVRSHRKHGIASALLAASHAAFVAAGFTHAALGVDTENPTGAHRLYERLHYRPVRRAVTHEIAL